MANIRLPENKKRKAVSLRLPPDIVKWLRKQPYSQADIIIEALREKYSEIREEK